MAVSANSHQADSSPPSLRLIPAQLESTVEDSHFAPSARLRQTGALMNAPPSVLGLALMATTLLATSACDATASKSEAYQLGYKAGAAYAKLADQAEVANSWDPEASLDPDGIRRSSRDWCEVEWMGQGLRLQIENTPENKEDFLSGCSNGFQASE